MGLGEKGGRGQGKGELRLQGQGFAWQAPLQQLEHGRLQQAEPVRLAWEAVQSVVPCHRKPEAASAPDQIDSNNDNHVVDTNLPITVPISAFRLMALQKAHMKQTRYRDSFRIPKKAAAAAAAAAADYNINARRILETVLPKGLREPEQKRPRPRGLSHPHSDHL
ncbi:MAG: hypothetical protein FRX49_13293 [Trebouxia sp. A1-2]|nr:MAG: hypothetical protein FRX49_13293 [Trebouxia sp. A1-2]